MVFADLNSDLGESFGAYKIGQDDQIIPLLACGGQGVMVNCTETKVWDTPNI